MTRPTAIALTVIAAIYIACSCIGITWGLPSRDIDKYLFGQETPWSGQEIYRLANVGNKFNASRGADVDPDPIDKSSGQPIHLTKTKSDVAKIYLRYRLFTHQPDEMITMMALAGMKPRQLQFDPKLYQYGGLFIYPVGGLIKLCGLLGLIEVRSDIVYYLDHPSEFGKFYIVARAYVAAWGLLGVFMVFAIARRLSSEAGGIVAAALFAIMPVVVCMSHEGKPHLPGAVLMLCAVYFAMCIKTSPRWSWWLMCISCGAAVGMVLSSAPILILIPLVSLIQYASWDNSHDEAKQRVGITLITAAKRSLAGVIIAIVTYLITNPYILINAINNRSVIESNFGNSLAMYDVSLLGEGLLRVIALTAEGATWLVLVCGAIAMAVGIYQKRWDAMPLFVSAGVCFVQFVLMSLFFMQFVHQGAGMSAEYARFGIFIDSALAIGVGCIVPYVWNIRTRNLTFMFMLLVIVNVGVSGSRYLKHFHADTTASNSRTNLAKLLSFDANTFMTRGRSAVIAIPAEPAPYNCPPLNFSKVDIVLCQPSTNYSAQAVEDIYFWIHVEDSKNEGIYGSANLPAQNLLSVNTYGGSRDGDILNQSLSPISWADKPFILFARSRDDK